MTTWVVTVEGSTPVGGVTVQAGAIQIGPAVNVTGAGLPDTGESPDAVGTVAVT